MPFSLLNGEPMPDWFIFYEKRGNFNLEQKTIYIKITVFFNDKTSPRFPFPIQAKNMNFKNLLI